MFKTFFKGEYINGYIVFPYLFLSPLLLMLFQTISNQFLVIKKTWPSTLILCFGAVINLILNYWLVKAIGIEGSAISTLIGYAVSVVVACVVLSNMKLISISKRIKLMSFVVTLFILFWRFTSPIKIGMALLISIPCLSIFIYLYRQEVITVYSKIISLIKRKKKEQ